MRIYAAAAAAAAADAGADAAYSPTDGPLTTDYSYYLLLTTDYSLQGEQLMEGDLDGIGEGLLPTTLTTYYSLPTTHCRGSS